MTFETKCVRIRLKPNSLERVREWATALNDTRRDEALATLRDESVVVECAFLERTAEGDFLIYSMKAESLARATQAVTQSAHDIDRFHREFKKDVWEASEPLELLVDLDRIGETAG